MRELMRTHDVIAYHYFSQKCLHFPQIILNFAPCRRSPAWPTHTDSKDNSRDVNSIVCGSIIIHKIRIAEMFVFFNSRDELQRIDVSKIVYFEADGNYTTIVMVNKLQASVCMNLGEMEKALAIQLGSESHHFMRIGKRFIINMDYVYSINVQKQQLVLSDYDHFSFKISISKEALKKMKELMVTTYIESRAWKSL